MFIFSYSVDFRDRREIQFTMGGRLTNNKVLAIYNFLIT